MLTVKTLVTGIGTLEMRLASSFAKLSSETGGLKILWLTLIYLSAFRTEKSLFPWAKEQMEQKFTDYLIFEDDKTKVWFSSVDSFKVRALRCSISYSPIFISLDASPCVSVFKHQCLSFSAIVDADSSFVVAAVGRHFCA